jgi:hypothetical protein
MATESTLQRFTLSLTEQMVGLCRPLPATVFYSSISTISLKTHTLGVYRVFRDVAHHALNTPV